MDQAEKHGGRVFCRHSLRYCAVGLGVVDHRGEPCCISFVDLAEPRLQARELKPKVIREDQFGQGWVAFSQDERAKRLQRRHDRPYYD